MKYLKQIIAYMLPMQHEAAAFVDVVSGSPVSYFRERASGRRVLAETRFSLFRVATVG